ncbi:glycosyl transferase group 1 [Catenulispora acidiphila DSM 44928]|uniref:Glycosyl transferase group 1 n=1 Tax=Catenulispora acidiphila (strain DSM 44928 / JCM 14897 / NBRC 102108 / NRRL B-24433 / ID139908) TaxID=479433 RepID=C7PYL2_CATAD|nr:glycosyltransferase [Catenulispora acidiphila]ACU77334.1 glycosyl transferase group 1 [Catenulispora acidiphila DSM 44928]
MTERIRTPHAVLVLLNLPVPDDQRAWSQALALRDDGARVTVVCPAIRGRKPGRERIDGIEVIRFRSFEGQGPLATAAEGFWTAAAAGEAARGALRSSPASARMLQIGNPPDLLFPLAWWARRTGIRTVYDQRDVVPVLAASRAGFSRLTPLFLAAERRMITTADVVITPSEEQRARILSRYGRDALIIRTAEVPAEKEAEPDAAAVNETDAAAVAEPDDAAVAPDSAPTALAPTLTIGYLGVIGEQDGLTDLLDAVALLRADGLTGFRVEVAGDGPALPAARAHATRLGLDALVAFHGWLGPGAVDAFLGRIDAMAVPDPDNPFNHFCAMNKVTHAMARGIPIALRPLRENVRLTAGHAYEAADMTIRAFADALAALLKDTPAGRSDIAAEARATFEAHHSWPHHAPRYVAAVSPTRR